MTVLVGLRERLDWLVDKAKKRGLEYRDVLGAMVKAAYPDVPGNPYSGDVAEDVRALAETVVSHPDNLALMRDYVLRLVRGGYTPLLVDCLGLPEVYEVYSRVAERCGFIAISIRPYINSQALTKRFKDAFLSQTMAEIAERLGAELYKVIDKTLFGEFGKPRNLEELLELADARLGGMARGLANDAVNSKKSVIISDHGYDVYCDNTRRCHLAHGPKGRLSRIAPVVIVEC
jgi:hypothetical protein